MGNERRRPHRPGSRAAHGEDWRALPARRCRPTRRQPPRPRSHRRLARRHGTSACRRPGTSPGRSSGPVGTASSPTRLRRPRRVPRRPPSGRCHPEPRPPRTRLRGQNRHPPSPTSRPGLTRRLTRGPSHSRDRSRGERAAPPATRLGAPRSVSAGTPAVGSVLAGTGLGRRVSRLERGVPRPEASVLRRTKTLRADSAGHGVNVAHQFRLVVEVVSAPSPGAVTVSRSSSSSPPGLGGS